MFIMSFGVPRVPTAMAGALSAWRERTEYPAGTDPVFASKVGTALNYSNIYNRVWIPARDAADVHGEGAFHRFRHTLGSLIHDQGAKTPRQLSDWLGHSDISFTQRVYVGQMDNGLGDADFLDDLIPVDGARATGGQRDTHRQPQIEDSGDAENGCSQARNAEEPQRTASA
jgi:hypothetical protein